MSHTTYPYPYIYLVHQHPGKVAETLRLSYEDDLVQDTPVASLASLSSGDPLEIHQRPRVEWFVLKLREFLAAYAEWLVEYDKWSTKGKLRDTKPCPVLGFEAQHQQPGWRDLRLCAYQRTVGSPTRLKIELSYVRYYLEVDAVHWLVDVLSTVLDRVDNRLPEPEPAPAPAEPEPAPVDVADLFAAAAAPKRKTRKRRTAAE